MTKRILVLFVFLCCQVAAMAQLALERKDIYRGNARFSEENLDGAIGEYRKALQKDSTSYSANYNLGNTVYKSAVNETNAEVRAGKFEEASRFLDKAMETDPTFESWFNKGNVLMQQENYQQAVDAYKEALLLNPGDMDAKRNYIYARQKAQQQQDQQQNQQNQNDQNQDQNQNNDQQQNQDQNQDQNDDQNQDNQQDNNKDQQNNQDQNKDQNKDQNQDQNKNNNQDKDNNRNNDQSDPNQDQNQQGDSQPQQGKMDQRQAEQLLQAIADKEKKTQEKVREAEAAKAVGARSDKNW